MKINQLEQSLKENNIQGVVYDFSLENPLQSNNKEGNAETYAREIKQRFPKESRMQAYVDSLVSLLINVWDNHILWRHPIVDDNNVLEQLDGSSKLVIGIHGLLQSRKAFYRLRNSLHENGFSFLSVGYDSKPFEQCAEEVLEELNTLSGEPHSKAFLLGHSTGADILRYLFAKEKISGKRTLSDKFDGLILSAPMTNGKVPDIKDKILFRNLDLSYHNPETEKGREILAYFKETLLVPNITVPALNDSFVPLASSLDLSGINLVLGKHGHIAETGCNQQFNQVYLSCLENF